MTRLLRLTLMLCASSVGAQTPVTARQSRSRVAEPPAQTLRIVDSIVIAGPIAKTDFASRVFSGPKGQLLVTQGAYYAGFDSIGHQRWSKRLGRRLDIANISSAGWLGDTLWIFDGMRGDIALMDAYGNMAKSLEIPSLVRPRFSERKKYPVFNGMLVTGLLPDRSMIVEPYGQKPMLGARPFDDEHFAYRMKVSVDGIIANLVVQVPTNVLPDQWPQGGPSVFDRRANRPLIRVSIDAARIAAVDVITTSPTTDTVVVRMFSDRGDTIYAQRFARPAVTFTEAQIDSIVAKRFGPDPKYRAKRSKDLPRRWPAVFDLVVDSDRSAWLTFRATETSREVIGLAPDGRIIGTLLLPSDRVVKAADRGRIWVGDSPQGRRRDLVRYTLRK